MADNITLNSGTGGATVRTLEDGSSIQWPASVACYATTVGNPDVLQVVTTSNGLPVAQQGTWDVGTVTTITNVVHVDDNSSSLTVDAPVGTPVFVRLSDGSTAISTLPVSAASLPLPSGASTAAKQPALGTAGSASSDVITVQGITSMTALKVDGSAVTQPVSGTFWQATQPISGTVTANAGTGTMAVSLASLPALAAGTNNIGDVDVLSLPATPAGTNLIGKVSSSDETDTIYSGATALTPKFVAITASTSGDNSIVAAVSGKKIRVLRWNLSSSGAVNAKFRKGTTDITGLHYLTQYAGVGGGYCPVGHFETGTNEALQVNLSSAVAVGGSLTYIEV